MSGTTSPPEYAPTATTSYTLSSTSALYDEEISRRSLIKTPLHKSVYDSLTEIYSILPTLEMVELSFVKDYITDKEKYTSTSYRLINQFQIILKGFLDDTEKLSFLTQFLPGLSPDLNNFLDLMSKKFSISCPQAVKRLKLGVPATIEHLNTQVESNSHPQPSSTTPSNSNASARLIAEITGNFITCMDAVKLNYRSKDQLHPLLSELVVNLNDLVEKNEQHNTLEFLGKSKLVNWLIKINNLGDSDEISESDAEAFLNDLDLAYKGFYTSLE